MSDLLQRALVLLDDALEQLLEAAQRADDSEAAEEYDRINGQRDRLVRETLA